MSSRKKSYYNNNNRITFRMIKEISKTEKENGLKRPINSI